MVNGVLGQTSVLVRHALSGNCTGAATASRRREKLLAMLEAEYLTGGDTAIDALRQAVRESERVLEEIQPLPTGRPS